MKKGDLFNLTHEEFSCYEIQATMQALRDFTMSDIRQQLDSTENSIRRDTDYGYRYDVEKLGEWMAANGYAEKVECAEFWAGCSGDLANDKQAESQ